MAEQVPNPSAIQPETKVLVTWSDGASAVPEPRHRSTTSKPDSSMRKALKELRQTVRDLTR